MCHPERVGGGGQKRRRGRSKIIKGDRGGGSKERRKIMFIDTKYKIAKIKEKLMFWVAWKTPKWLVYFCSIRLMAHATQGKHGSQIVDDLTAMDALKRWEPTGENPNP